jgi:hypothetical protein
LVTSVAAIVASFKGTLVRVAFGASTPGAARLVCVRPPSNAFDLLIRRIKKHFKKCFHGPTV